MGKGSWRSRNSYESACKDLDNEPLILEVSRRLLQAKRNDKALDLVSRATARRNASGILFARLGFIHAQMEKPDLAREADQNAIRRRIPTLSLVTRTCFCLKSRGTARTRRWTCSIDAAKVSKPEPEFLIGLAELYGTYGSQIPRQRKLVAIAAGCQFCSPATNAAISDPHLATAARECFQLCSARMRKRPGFIEELVDRLPDASFLRDELRAKLAEIYLQENDSERAAKQLAGITRRTIPRTSRRTIFWGNSPIRTGNTTQAAEHFSKVVLLNPDVEPAYYELADAQISAGKSEDAISHAGEGAAEVFVEFPVGIPHGPGLQLAKGLHQLGEIPARCGNHRQHPDSRTVDRGTSISNLAPPASARAITRKATRSSRNAWTWRRICTRRRITWDTCWPIAASSSNVRAN